jgi:hypothetical protein
VLLCLALCLRRAIRSYGRKISVNAMGPWEQLSHAGIALFSTAHSGDAESRLSKAGV